MTFKVTLPWPSGALSPNARGHWSAKSKAAKAYRADCFNLTKQALHATMVTDAATVHMLSGIATLHLWLDFYPPDRRHRDDDNMIAAFKSGRDGLAEALGINDKRFVTHPKVMGEIGGMVKVRITGWPVGVPVPDLNANQG